MSISAVCIRTKNTLQHTYYLDLCQALTPLFIETSPRCRQPNSGKETGWKLNMSGASERSKSFDSSSPENILVVGRGNGSTNKRANPEDPLQQTHIERIRFRHLNDRSTAGGGSQEVVWCDHSVVVFFFFFFSVPKWDIRYMHVAPFFIKWVGLMSFWAGAQLVVTLLLCLPYLSQWPKCL